MVTPPPRPGERDDARLPADARPTLDEVADRHGDAIYRLAYRLTGDPHDAADLAQDVFERVSRNLDRYTPGTFEGWLYRITKNLFLDSVRKRSRQRTDPLPDEDLLAPSSASPDPVDVIERRAAEASILDALRELPADFRLAVVLCDLEGLHYDEIAQVTGWPKGTVRSRIHRGRKQLRARLEASPAARGGGDG